MYSISEVSTQTSIPASTIRYYEKEGLLPNIKRTSGSRRQFDDGDIQWLQTIMCFLKTGMPLATIRRIVTLAQQGESTVDERREILLQHKENLLQQQRDLDTAMMHVNRKLELYETKEKTLEKVDW